MEFSLLVRRVEQLEARTEDVASLRHSLSVCQSQLAYFQCEVERLQRLSDRLESADSLTLQLRSQLGSSGLEVPAERTLHIESCLDWLVRALQRHFPGRQWQSLDED